MAGLDRVRAEGRTLGRPSVGRTVEEAIRRELALGHGILKVAKIVGVWQRDGTASETGNGK